MDKQTDIGVLKEIYCLFRAGVAGHYYRRAGGKLGGCVCWSGARVGREVGVVHQRYVWPVVRACCEVEEAGIGEEG
jgi:hypothetical protein